MKVLVTGYTGQLGYDVVHRGKAEGLNMIGVGSQDLDITDKDAVNHYIEKLKPDAIIHCAAFTSVDKAEDEKETCRNINVVGTKNLVEVTNNIHAKFMYISTDYVFNGEGEQPFKETDKTEPIGHYGQTKLEGEEVVRTQAKDWFIVRISWVFGINGNNFVKTMLRLAEKNKEVNVVNDQIGSPTYTFDLARLLIDMIQSDKYGTYHASNEGYCSWADFAKEIFKQSGKNVEVNEVTTEEYPTPASRPKNSRLEKQKLIKNDFTPLPTWQDAITRFLKELKEEVK